jgi:tetratricopeptide (TPR) repeat protein
MQSQNLPAHRAKHPQRNRWLRLSIIVVVLSGGAFSLYQIALQMWANVQYRAAQEASARHDYQEAGNRIANYVQARPGDWQGWLLGARIARQSGSFAHADTFLREAKKKAAPPLALNLERNLLAIQAGNVEDSDELLEDFSQRSNADETALVIEAIAEGSLRARDVARLRRMAKLWLEQRPSAVDQAHGLIWLGHADKLGNETGSAIAHFQKAVELDPDHPHARLLLVASLVHDRPHEARPHLELLQRQRPDDTEVLFQTARMHRYLGYPEKAIPLLDQVLASGPDLVPALVERGRIALDLGKAEQAEPWLQKAARRAPNDRLVLITLGDCMRQLDRPAEAKALHDRAEKIEEMRKLQEAARNKKQ